MWWRCERLGAGDSHWSHCDVQKGPSNGGGLLAAYRLHTPYSVQCVGLRGMLEGATAATDA